MSFSERFTLGEPCESSFIGYVDGRRGWRAEPFGVGRFNAPFLNDLRCMRGELAAAVRLTSDALIINRKLGLVYYADVKTKQEKYKNFSVALDVIQQADRISSADCMPPLIFVFADPGRGPGLWRVCPAATLPRYAVHYLSAGAGRGSGKACLIISADSLPCLSEFIADPCETLADVPKSPSVSLQSLGAGVNAQ